MPVSTAAIVRSRVDALSPGEFVRALDFDEPRSKVDVYLSREEIARDDFVRVNRGLYWKGVDSRYGPGRPYPIDVALEVTGGVGVGPTSWSASHVVGLSTQVPGVAELATVGVAPSGIRGVSFHLRSNIKRVDLSFLEIAVLEVLRNYPAYSESDWDSVVGAIERLASTGRISIKKIVVAARSEKSRPLRANLARLLVDIAWSVPSSN